MCIRDRIRVSSLKSKTLPVFFTELKTSSLSQGIRVFKSMISIESFLNDFIESNPGIHINESYTTLGLNVIHENSNYNFFENQINLWAVIGDNSKFLTSISASSNDEILVPFSSVIQDYIDGELSLSDSIVFYIDGVYDNRSRLVMHKNNEDLSPKLEVFYSR